MISFSAIVSKSARKCIELLFDEMDCSVGSDDDMRYIA